MCSKCLRRHTEFRWERKREESCVWNVCQKDKRDRNNIEFANLWIYYRWAIKCSFFLFLRLLEKREGERETERREREGERETHRDNCENEWKKGSIRNGCWQFLVSSHCFGWFVPVVTKMSLFVCLCGVFVPSFFSSLSFLHNMCNMIYCRWGFCFILSLSVCELSSVAHCLRYRVRIV